MSLPRELAMTGWVNLLIKIKTLRWSVWLPRAQRINHAEVDNYFQPMEDVMQTDLTNQKTSLIWGKSALQLNNQPGLVKCLNHCHRLLQCKGIHASWRHKEETRVPRWYAWLFPIYVTKFFFFPFRKLSGSTLLLLDSSLTVCYSVAMLELALSICHYFGLDAKPYFSLFTTVRYSCF